MDFKNYFYKNNNYIIIFLILIVGIAIPIIQYLNLQTFYILILTEVSLVIIAVRDFLSQRKNDIEEQNKKVEEASKKLEDAKFRERIEKEIAEKSEMKEKQKTLENRQRVISVFLKDGVVNNDDLLQSINQESFTILYYYNRGLDQKYAQFLPNKQSTIMNIIDTFNFVPVGSKYGAKFFFVVNTDSLPKDLRQPAYLEAYIRREVLLGWKTIEEKIKANDKKEYEKLMTNKNFEFNLAYITGRIFSAEMRIGYLNYPIFNEKFLPYLASFSKKLKNIDKKKLEQIISLASISYFISSVELEPKDKELILSKEPEIKKQLHIKNLFDYEKIPLQSWEEVLFKLFGQEKAKKYASEIYNSVKSDLPIIKSFLY